MEHWIRAFINIDLSPNNDISYTELLEIIKQNQKHIVNIWVEKSSSEKRIKDLESMLSYEKSLVSELSSKSNDQSEKISLLEKKLNSPLTLSERLIGKLLM